MGCALWGAGRSTPYGAGEGGKAQQLMLDMRMAAKLERAEGGLQLSDRFALQGCVEGVQGAAAHAGNEGGGKLGAPARWLVQSVLLALDTCCAAAYCGLLRPSDARL